MSASTPIILSMSGTISVTKEGSTATCQGDFGLDSPSRQVIFPDYLNVPNGTSKTIGSFNAGQELIFFIKLKSTFCGFVEHKSNEMAYARVTQYDVDAWLIEWEDHPGDPADPPGGDFDDLVVDVQRVRGPGEPPVRRVPYDPRSRHFGLRPYAGLGGEPVSTALGNFYTQHQDLSVPGRGLPVNFTRAYNSLDTRVASFGRGWWYPYDMRAEERGDGSVIVTFPDGRAGVYQRNGACAYERPRGFFAELSRCSGQLVLTEVNQTAYAFNNEGKLASITDSNSNRISLAYDSHGYTLTDTVGRTFRVNLNGDGYIQELVDPIARSYKYDYIGNRLMAFHDAQGGTIQYTYDGDGRMLSITDPNNHTFVTNHYDQERVDWQKDAAGSITTFSYQDSPRHTTIKDNLGNTTVQEFDEQYRLVKETDALGNSMIFGYDDDFNRTYIKDRGSHETFMTYDGHGNMLTHKDAAGQTAMFQYDSHNNLTRARDEAGAETIYEYDTHDNLVHIRDAEGLDTRMAYDSHGLLQTLTMVNGGVTKFTYDAQANLQTLEDALGYLTRIEYDGVSRRTAMTDANSHVVRFVYDRNDRVTSIIDPLGKPTFFTYDRVGNLTSTTDRRGGKTTYEYNENDSLIKVTDALNNSATFTYDKMYHRLSFTDRRGNTTRYEYDPVYNLTKVVDALGNPTTFGYDADRNLTSVTNAKGKTTRFGYNNLHLLTSLTNPLGFATTYTYDAVRRLTKVTDAEANSTQYQYDQIDRLTDVIDALNGHTHYAYDNIGNLTAYTDANGHKWTFDVDLLGRVIREINPIGNTWQYQYDGVGNLIQRTDAKGVVTRYTFDAADRLVRITYPSGSPVNMGYDDNDNLTSLSDVSGAASFTYDPLNRLTQASRTAGILAGKTLTYAYDAEANRIQITYPDGKVVGYGYNANNWLTSVSDPLGGVTRYTYDPVGLPTRIDHPNGTWAEFGYDDADRLVHLLNGTPKHKLHLISSFDYTLDRVGNRIRTVERYGRDDGITWTKDYSYDKLYRLTKVAARPDFDPDEVLMYMYAYDAVGNRLSQTFTLQDSKKTPPPFKESLTVNYAYNAANQLLTAKSTMMKGDGKPREEMTQYAYDANGNRVSTLFDKRAIDYSYDFENRLAGVQFFKVEDKGKRKLESALAYVHDGLGRRLERAELNKDGDRHKAIDFFYDGLGYDLLAEYSDKEEPRATFYYRDPVHVLSRHELNKEDKGPQLFYHSDGLGSVSALSNHEGNVERDYAYDPYGQLVKVKDQEKLLDKLEKPNTLTFSGKPWDEDTGLYYFGARDYDPSTGTWVTQDPYRGMTRDPITLHRHQYVKDNPINWFDPFGFDMGPRSDNVIFGLKAKDWQENLKDVIEILKHGEEGLEKFGKILEIDLRRIRTPRIGEFRFPMVKSIEKWLGRNARTVARSIEEAFPELGAPARTVEKFALPLTVAIEGALLPLNLHEYHEAEKEYQETKARCGENHFLTASAKWNADFKKWSVIPVIGQGIAAIKSVFTPKPAGGDIEDVICPSMGPGDYYPPGTIASPDA